jgi:oxygen-dependent protoporphyrinogen oxidase
METTRVAIIGAGITGLAAAYWLEHDHGIDDLVVLESGEEPGGKIWTTIDDGYCLESGPQGFLDNAPDTLELCRAVGLDGSLVRADDDSAARFILRDGVLRAVPISPVAFLTSDVLPLRGRLRVLGEPFARRRPADDESVFDFATRRIGRRAASILVDAMVTGVFAGNSRELSLAATFPRMAAMEAEHGSLTRALMAKMREARAGGRQSSGPAGPGGTLTSFEGGMVLLPRTLATGLGDRLRCGAAVGDLERREGHFRLSVAEGGVDAEAVLLATPADTSAQLLATTAPAAVGPLHRIETSPIVVVMTSYADPAAFGRPVQGFGFLVPGIEAIDVLGTLFCHCIFPGQAPPGHLLLRTMVGGARDPDAIRLDDNALLARTRSALAAVLGRDPDPTRHWIIRWEHGISQYTIGHLDRVATAEQAARQAGIELAGSPYRGVSVNDCIRQARDAAARIAGRLNVEG